VEKHILLHVEDLLAREGVVSEIDEVFDSRWVDFLVFSRNEQRRDADQLHFRLVHVEEGEVSVNQVDCQVERFGQQFELGVYADDPVHQDRAHVFVYVRLLAHIEAVGLRLLFCRLHVRLNVIAVKTHVVDVSKRRHVHFVDARDDSILNALLVGLQFVVEANRGQFVSRA